MTIHELPKEFTGTGEVKGFTFRQVGANGHGYIYAVSQPHGSVHFEVFKRNVTRTLIDFEKRIYSDTEMKIRYPKSKDFGLWAWSCYTTEQAMLKLKKIENDARKTH